MDNGILRAIRNAQNLPSLPTVAIDVLRLTRRDDVSFDELVNVIQSDPALAGKILKAVNSSMYGVPREVGSIRQAVGLLGLRAVKILALSFSVADAVQGAGGAGLDLEAYWRNSVSCAVAARHLAQAVCRQQSEEAFVCGLLADIGIIAAWRCAPGAYGPVLAARDKQARSLAEIESQRLGFTHARISRELLETWGLPANICEAVGTHNDPSDRRGSGDVSPLVRVVRCAAAIADLFSRETAPCELDAVKAGCLRLAGIDATLLESVLEELDRRVRETASNLAVPVGQTIDYAQLQSEAAAQLVQVSMQVELERSQSAREAKTARSQAQRLHEEKREILKVASTDALTGLPNRAAFDARLLETIEQARRRGQAVSLLMLDVDRFKTFNDTYGHQAGDTVLRAVGACLAEIAKRYGFAARYGGEEFAFVLSGESAASAPQIAELIRRSIAEHRFKHADPALHVTVSIGAMTVSLAEQSITGEQLVEGADRCLYRAKRGGRNRVETAGVEPIAALGTTPAITAGPSQDDFQATPTVQPNSR